MSAALLPSHGDRMPSGSVAAYMATLRGDPCAYCGMVGGHLDHIEALRRGANRSKGGADSWRNLTGACEACNNAKGAKTLVAFLGHQRWQASERGHLLRQLDDEARAWRRVGQ